MITIMCETEEEIKGVQNELEYDCFWDKCPLDKNGKKMSCEQCTKERIKIVMIGKYE